MELGIPFVVRPMRTGYSARGAEYLGSLPCRTAANSWRSPLSEAIDGAESQAASDLAFCTVGTPDEDWVLAAKLRVPGSPLSEAIGGAESQAASDLAFFRGTPDEDLVLSALR